jgi:hypothetical protein
MTATGWVGEGPDDGPGLPLTEMLLGRREHRAGPLEIALARSRATEAREARDAAAFAPDPDERAAGLVARGLAPGMISDLALRLGDVMGQIEAENVKIEKGKRRQEHLHRAHAAGQITAWDVARGRTSMRATRGALPSWSGARSPCGGRSPTRRRSWHRRSGVPRIRWRRLHRGLMLRSLR